VRVASPLVLGAGRSRIGTRPACHTIHEIDRMLLGGRPYGLGAARVLTAAAATLPPAGVGVPCDPRDHGERAESPAFVSYGHAAPGTLWSGSPLTGRGGARRTMGFASAAGGLRNAAPKSDGDKALRGWDLAGGFLKMPAELAR
jgi:hypothetical protein